MATIFDSKANFAIVTVTRYYTATATQITVDDATRLPTAPFNGTWYDSTNYPNPADDPNREIVRVTGKSGETLTLESSGGNRVAQEGTTASTKNTSGSTYKLVVGLTKKDFDDIEDAGIDVGSKYAWVTEHGATGDGSTDDYAAFVSAITTYARTYIVIPAGTYRIASNLTVPAGTCLVPLPGALLYPDAGVTITVNGHVSAGPWAWYGGSGSVSLSNCQSILRYDAWNDTATTNDLDVQGYLSLSDKRLTVGSAAPTTGTWAVGDFVVNSEPSTDEALGWRCTGAGTPGTWETMPKGTSGTTISTFQSAEIALDQAAGTAIDEQITHSLGTAPDPEDVQATLVVTSGYSGTDPPYTRGIYVHSITTTTLNCRSYILDAGATDTKGRFVVWIKTG